MRSLLQTHTKFIRAPLIGGLRSITKDIISRVGTNALMQMTTYKMLNVLSIHEDTFVRGLGYEIGLYLFSKYRIYTDGMVLQIKNLLGKVRLFPEDKNQVGLA